MSQEIIAISGFVEGRNAPNNEPTVTTINPSGLDNGDAEKADKRTMKAMLVHHRTPLEKILFLIIVFLAIFSLCLIITLGVLGTKSRRNYSRPGESWMSDSAGGGSDVCGTPACIRAALEVSSSIKIDVMPCDDFYEFSCGKWISDNALVSPSLGRFTQLSKDLLTQFKEMLESMDKNDPEHFKKAKTYYSYCMDLTKRDETAPASFLHDFDSVNGFPLLLGEGWDPEKFELMDFIEDSHKKGYKSFDVASLGLMNDYRNTTIRRLTIHQPELSLEPTIFFQSQVFLPIYAKSYMEMIAALSIVKGDSTADQWGPQIKAAIDLEVNISKVLLDNSVMGNKTKTYNLMTIDELQTLAPQIEWLRLIRIYFSEYGIDSTETIMVTLPDVITKVAEIIGNQLTSPEGKRTLANLLCLRRLMHSANDLNLRLSQIHDNMYSIATQSFTIKDLWLYCVEETAEVFDFSLASVYVKKKMSPERRKAIKELISGIRSELAEVIKGTTWMDKETLRKALEKVEMIDVMAVHPDGVLHDNLVNQIYDGLELSTDHFENTKLVFKFFAKKEMAGYRDAFNRSDWTNMPVKLLSTDAVYLGQNNSIFVPLGITVKWFFEEGYPNYVNYGRIGYLLGHEFSHAFDVNGAKLDGMGNWVMWWDNSTVEHFEKKTECMVNQFSQYSLYIHEMNKTIHLDGNRTLDENIADDIGVMEAYRAYKKAEMKKPSKKLPGLSLTQNQLFWVNFAMVWCSKIEPNSYEQVFETDEHAPAKMRVNNPLSNSEDFAKDFNCKPGTRMNPSRERCHVWGDKS